MQNDNSNDNALARGAQDTAAWTVSRVAEFCPSAISDPGAPAAILTNVMASLDDTPRVCEKVVPRTRRRRYRCPGRLATPRTGGEARGGTSPPH